ncbi:MAG: hypothetical protein HQ483_06535 [Rhodospirillales bacterium]|nr:hypothetical protein [Rhodospirillales bacterium]
MTYNILILGASYGSLLGTKLLMAGHNVTLVCRKKTAQLINDRGTEVLLKLSDEASHRVIRSVDLPGKLNALSPDAVDPTACYDLVCLAMQEPQYGAQEIWALMTRIAEARIPCLSIMNMPPLPYLKRIPGLDTAKLESCYTNPRVWDNFDPQLITLCSPDPQAFRPPDEAANVLHVGLPTNFKAAPFGDVAANRILTRLDADISAIRLDGQDVPVKLRVFGSVFVPLANWGMLLTGNYRCITRSGSRCIRDAVHDDTARSQAIYSYVNTIAQQLGASRADQVPFEKYARAAEGLHKPSSAARAIADGAAVIERADKLVQLIGRALGMNNPEIDEIVALVDEKLRENQRQSA